MHEFRHGRVLFVGDAAHRVSPFGARGALGHPGHRQPGVETQAGDGRQSRHRRSTTSLARRNLRRRRTSPAQARSTDFITQERRQQDLPQCRSGLAKCYPFARALVRPGRLSVPTCLTESTLNAGCGRFCRRHGARRTDGRRAGGAPAGSAVRCAEGGRQRLPAAVFRRRCLGNRCCAGAGAGRAGRRADPGAGRGGGTRRRRAGRAGQRVRQQGARRRAL
ncbi:MAG: FAD-dependent monooxygenase [Rhodocyclaceae bacterium]